MFVTGISSMTGTHIHIKGGNDKLKLICKACNLEISETLTELKDINMFMKMMAKIIFLGAFI